MDKVWYTKSLTTDFNGGWSQDIIISEGNEFARSPSIDLYGNTLAVVYEGGADNMAFIKLLELNINTGSRTYSLIQFIDDDYFGNALPVVFYSNVEKFILYKKSLNEGLNYTRKYKVIGGWSDWEESSLPNSTSFSKNPSIVGNNSTSNMHIVWQEGTAQIRYWFVKKKTDEVLEFHSFEVISSGNGYSVNEFPSISLMESYSNPIVSWTAKRKEQQIEKITGENTWVWVNRMVTLPGTYSGSVNWGNFYITGSNVGFTNNNSTSGSTAQTIIAWSENNGTASKWLKRTGTTYSFV